MMEKRCIHCKKNADITLCKSCYSNLSCKATWNEGASKNEMFSCQYLEILNILYKLVSKINNLELQLNLAKKLKIKL